MLHHPLLPCSLMILNVIKMLQNERLVKKMQTDIGVYYGLILLDTKLSRARVV